MELTECHKPVTKLELVNKSRENGNFEKGMLFKAFYKRQPRVSSLRVNVAWYLTS